jgi:hypothetical protein
MELPFKAHKPLIINPRKLVIYSKVKVGKTELVSHLSDFEHLKNYIILDFEGGTDFFEANSIRIRSMDDLREFVKKVKEYKDTNGKLPYKIGVVDTVTMLEDMARPLALSIFKKTPIWAGMEKKGEVLENILHLPQGGGYQYLRDAMERLLNTVEELFETVIYLGHIKLSKVETAGKEVTTQDIDLLGKNRSMLLSQADAVGVLYREKPGVNKISFRTREEVVCGARSSHLENQEFVLSEKTKEGYKTYWDKIFLP